MAGKRKIRLKECASLMRSGMGAAELARHYRLSTGGVKKLLNTLVDAGVMSHQELCGCCGMYRRMAEGCEERTDPRLDLIVPVVVSDLDSSATGIVRDLAENGCRIAGIDCTLGELKRFRISFEALSNFNPITIGARCVWTSREGTHRPYTCAGFEITEISPEDSQSLTRFMDLLVMSHSGEWQAMKPSPQV